MEKNTVMFQPPEWLDELVEATRQTHDTAQKLKVELENLNRITELIQRN